MTSTWRANYHIEVGTAIMILLWLVTITTGTTSAITTHMTTVQSGCYTIEAMIANCDIYCETRSDMVYAGQSCKHYCDCASETDHLSSCSFGNFIMGINGNQNFLCGESEGYPNCFVNECGTGEVTTELPTLNWCENSPVDLETVNYLTDEVVDRIALSACKNGLIEDINIIKGSLNHKLLSNTGMLAIEDNFISCRTNLDCTNDEDLKTLYNEVLSSSAKKELGLTGFIVPQMEAICNNMTYDYSYSKDEIWFEDFKKTNIIRHNIIALSYPKLDNLLLGEECWLGVYPDYSSSTSEGSYFDIRFDKMVEFTKKDSCGNVREYKLPTSIDKYNTKEVSIKPSELNFNTMPKKCIEKVDHFLNKGTMNNHIIMSCLLSIVKYLKSSDEISTKFSTCPSYYNKLYEYLQPKRRITAVFGAVEKKLIIDCNNLILGGFGFRSKRSVEEPIYSDLCLGTVQTSFEVEPIKQLTAPTDIGNDLTKLSTQGIKLSCDELLFSMDRGDWDKLCGSGVLEARDTDIFIIGGAYVKATGLNVQSYRSYTDINSYNCTNCILSEALDGNCTGDRIFCENWDCLPTELNKKCNYYGSKSSKIVIDLKGTKYGVQGKTRVSRSIEMPTEINGYLSDKNCSRVVITQDKMELNINSYDIIEKITIKTYHAELIIKDINSTTLVVKLIGDMVVFTQVVEIRVKMKYSLIDCVVPFNLEKVGECSRFYSTWSTSRWVNIKCYTWWQWILVILMAIAFTVITILMLWMLVKLFRFLFYRVVWLCGCCNTKVQEMKLRRRIKKNEVENEEIDDLVSKGKLSKEQALKIMEMNKKLAELQKERYLKAKKKHVERGTIEDYANKKKHEKRLRNSKGYNNVSMIVILMIILFPLALGCDEVSTMSVNNNQCLINIDGSQTCSVSQIIQLNVMPKGQQSCFLIQDDNGANIGSFQVRTNSLSLACDKYSLYYTPSHIGEKQAFDSICNGDTGCAGSDSGCLYWYGGNLNTKRPEGEKWDWFMDSVTLPTIPENSLNYYACDLVSQPGYCLAGGRGCAGYWFAFTNLNNIASEIFECSSWKLQSELEITIIKNSGGVPSSEKISLVLGDKKNFDGYSVALTGAYTPPSIATSICFIDLDASKEEDKLLWVESCNKRDEYSSGKVGAIQCNSAEEALDNLASCSHATFYTHTTTYERLTLHTELVQPDALIADNMLPKDIGEVHLDSTNGIPQISVNDYGIIQVQLNVQDMKLVSATSKNICNMELVSIEGCYSCTSGAILTLRGHTNFDTATVHIECPSISYSTILSIDSTSKEYNITMQTSIKNIDSECTASCPGGTTRFSIEGTLEYATFTDHNDNSEYNTYDTMKGNSFWSALWDNWIFKGILIAVAVVIGLIIIFALIKFVIIPMCNKRSTGGSGNNKSD